MDADAEQKLLIFRHVPDFIGEAALHLDRHLDATDNAAEFRQDRIAGIMIDLAAASSSGMGQGGEPDAQGFVRCIFVLAGKARIASDIGVKDRRQLALYRLVAHLPPPRL